MYSPQKIMKNLIFFSLFYSLFTFNTNAQTVMVIKGDTIDLNNLNLNNINRLKTELNAIEKEKSVWINKAEKLATKSIARSARELLDDDDDKGEALKLSRTIKRAKTINISPRKTDENAAEAKPNNTNIIDKNKANTNKNTNSNNNNSKNIIVPEETIFNNDNNAKNINIEGQDKDLMEANVNIAVKNAEIQTLKQALNYQEAALDLKIAQQRTYYLVSVAIFAVLSLVAFNFYRHNKIRKKANVLLAKEKELTEVERKKSDDLLLNILPITIAQELKEKGVAPVKYYKMASVLFTDFKGFTNVAEKMTPNELVEELGNCFAKFDEITSMHHLEKIKTIGDAYMCAGGIPTQDTENPFNAVLAGLAMQAFMAEQHQLRAKEGKDYWYCRLGINSGDLIAGVIGKKKFAYDIWGDTVNTASRMESSGEVGKVNISQNTYQIIKDYFECEYRGKVSAKGKGEIDMYFVNRLKPIYSLDNEGIKENGLFWEDVKKNNF
ncbi:MAG: adenylate/guanylate cyclase domain-containing protein [Cytophagia bacterium]|nr:MAG: adenylate/guanylate cyclase domain-containing protein [Cytophagia bacterium]